MPGRSFVHALQWGFAPEDGEFVGVVFAGGGVLTAGGGVFSIWESGEDILSKFELSK